MPKVSGKDLISGLTEKNGRRLIVVSFLTILIKLYQVNLSELSVFGLSIPTELFDVVALVLIIYFGYALIVAWGGDLAGFRLWFDSNEMDSQIGTTMKLDRSFVNGGISLLRKLFELEKGNAWPVDYESLDPEIRQEFKDFNANVELYCERLYAAGKRFKMLSIYGHFYVWFQSFVFPLLIGSSALFILYCQGNFKVAQ